MAMAVDILISKNYLHDIDEGRLEDKLVIQLQSAISKTGCDVNPVSKKIVGEHFVARFLFHFTADDGHVSSDVKTSREREAVEKALTLSGRDIEIADRKISILIQRSTSWLMDPQQAQDYRGSHVDDKEYSGLLSSIEQKTSPTILLQETSHDFKDQDFSSVLDGLSLPSSSLDQGNPIQAEPSYFPLKATSEEYFDSGESTPSGSSLMQGLNKQTDFRNQGLVADVPRFRRSMTGQGVPESYLPVSTRSSISEPFQMGAGLSIQIPKKTEMEVTTIDVSGYRKADTVQRYFSQFARSMGDDIDRSGFVEDKRTGRINITFSDPRVVQAAIARVHELEGCQLKVVPAIRKKPHEVDKRCILLSGLPELTDPEHLELFLQAKTQLEEKPKVTYSKTTKGVALIRYRSELDIAKIIERMHGRTLKDSVVKAKLVNKPDCVLVKGIPTDTHKDTIRYFFEDIIYKQKVNHLDNGTELVSDVKILTETNQALVYLNDSADVDRVLQSPEIQFDQAVLSLEAFYECLGSAAVNSTLLGTCLPAPYVLKVSYSLTEYIMTTSAHKNNLQRATKERNAQIIWPYDNDQRKMRVEPVNTAHSASISWKNWESDTRHMLEGFFKRYQAEVVTVTDQNAESLMDCFQGVSFKFDVSIIKVRSKKNTFILRGYNRNVLNAKQSLDELIMQDLAKKEIEVQKEKSHSIVDFTQLKPHKINQLQQCRVIEKIQQDNPDVIITIQKEERRVKFEGEAQQAVLTARIKMLESLDNLIQRSLDLRPLKRQFILQAENHIHEHFSASNILATCIEDDTVKVTAASNSDAVRACKFLEKEIIYENKDYSKPEELSVLQDDAGIQFIEQVNEAYTTTLTRVESVDAKRGCVEIVGFSDGVEQVSQDISAYVLSNAAKEKFFNLSECQVAYLKIHFGRAEIHKSVEVNWSSEPTTGVFLKGKDEDVSKAMKVIQEEIAKIIEKDHPVSRIGIHSLHNDQAFLVPIEEEHKCAIKIKGNDAQQRGRGGRSSRTPERPTVLQEYRTQTGQTIEVCLGDLTMENVDAIVNAANTRMDHGGGVAEAIVDRGEHIIQDESNKIMQKKGHELNSGELIVTGSGRLQCKKVIHVVGPEWRSGRNQEEAILHDAVSNVFNEANKLGLASIALPAISSGIFGFPIGLCAKTMIQATCEFFRLQRERDLSVRTIRFTNIKEDVCKTFIDLLSDSPFTISSSSPTLEEERRFWRANEETELYARMPQAGTTSAARPLKVSKHLIKTAEGKTIQLRKGNIAKETVDAIVNTVGEDLKLSNGAVAAAILVEAGQSLQQECDMLLAGKMKEWSHLKTGPGKLRCKAVYHICCSHYDTYNDKSFVDSLKNVFKAADNNGMRSIAVPAIGSGNLKYPAHVVARLMFEAALSFSQENPRGSLNEIRFIQYEKDKQVIQAFGDEMKNIVTPSATTRTATQSVRPKTTSGAAKLRTKPGDKGKVYEEFTEDDDGSCHIKIHNVHVELTEGDIVKANTEVIVNSTNRDFDLEGPLSSAIIKVGGRKVEEECKKFSRSSNNTDYVAITTAGKFKQTKHIAHIMLDQGWDSATVLKQRVLTTLEKTEGLRMRSIAFPAIGTGVSNLGSIQDVAKALYEAIGTFVVSNPQHLLFLKIVIYDSSMFDEYKTVMHSMEGQEYSLDHHLGHRIWNKVKSGAGTLFNYTMFGRSSFADETFLDNEKPDTVVFHITAGSTQAIEAAEKDIDAFINLQFITENIPYEMETHGELSQQRKSKMQSLAYENETSIEFIIGEHLRASRLVIRGKKGNVTTTKGEIWRFLAQVQKEERQRVEDEALSKEVQWKYEDEYGGQYHPYDVPINARVESAYAQGLEILELELHEGKVLFDFIKMVEISGARRCNIRRSELRKEAVDRFPDHWDPSTRKGVVIIQQSNPEYQVVADSFFETADEGSYTIEEIKRIQNVELHKQYMAKKDTMFETLQNKFRPDQLEMHLFHGTSAKNLSEINNGGFNRSYQGSNGACTRFTVGTLYGKGTYFAKHADYSTDYADTDDSSGLQYMYRAKVLVGEYTKGEKQWLTPPKKPNSHIESYDSTVDNQDDPSIFVVYRDAQAYPEYIIMFKKQL